MPSASPYYACCVIYCVTDLILSSNPFSIFHKCQSVNSGHPLLIVLPTHFRNHQSNRRKLKALQTGAVPASA